MLATKRWYSSYSRFKMGYLHDFVFVLDYTRQVLKVKAFVIDSAVALYLDSIVIQAPFTIGLDRYRFIDLLKQMVYGGVRAGVDCPNYERVREVMTPYGQA